MSIGCLSIAGCSDTVAVEDLAHSLADNSSEEHTIADALQGANGGRLEIGGETAQLLQDRSGVLDEILGPADPVLDLACEAWSQGQTAVSISVPDSLTVDVRLKTMSNEVSTGQVSSSAINFACAIQKAKALAENF